MGIVAFDDLVRYRGVPSTFTTTPGDWTLPAENMADRRPALFARTSLLDVTVVVTLPATHGYTGSFVYLLEGIDISAETGGTSSLTVNISLGSSLLTPADLYASGDIAWQVQDGVPSRLVGFATANTAPRYLTLRIRNGALAAITDIGRLWFSPYRPIRFAAGWETDDDDAPDISSSEGGQSYARPRATRQQLVAEFRKLSAADRDFLRKLKRIVGKSSEVVSGPYGPTFTAAQLRAETVYGLADYGRFVHVGGQRWNMRWAQQESR